MSYRICQECWKLPNQCDCPSSMRCRSAIVVTDTEPEPVPTIENRLEGLDEYLFRAFITLSGRIKGEAPRIAAMMQRRVLNQGTSEYPNDPVFSKTEDQLEQDVFEELADALFYEAVRLDRLDRKI